MKLLIILIVSIIHSAKATDMCKFGDICPPIWPVKLKPYPQSAGNDDLAPIFLGKDDQTGCYCRERPHKFTVCFGKGECTSFTRKFRIASTPELRIKTTQIVELKAGDFINVSGIEKLLIDGNPQLTAIRPGTFRNMTSLRNMSISYNLSLRKFEAKSLDGASNLRELFLLKNGFTNVLDASIALTRQILPVLRKLAFNENNFVSIERNAFDPMQNSTLKELNLILCQIEYIHPYVLKPLSNLNVLRLGENYFFNNITILTELIETTTLIFHIPLRVLNLYSVGIRKVVPRRLFEVIAQSNVTHLSLARNHFDVITSASFPPPPSSIIQNNIQVLDLREVSATNITQDAFVNLPNLKTLLLSGNKLPSIPETILLDNLTYLDLQENSGNSRFAPPSYLTLTHRTFTNMTKLEWLNLCYNRINGIQNTTFRGLDNLKVLGLKNATIYEIANNSFAFLNKLRLLNLENNHFLKINSRGIERNIFRGLIGLEILLLGGNEIKFLSKSPGPFIDLKSLKHLGLENNHLIQVDPRDFLGLSNLKRLDLSGNALKPWQNPVFTELKHLEDCRLSSNKLTYFSVAMLGDLANLSYVELNENPFTCDCSVYLKHYQQVIITSRFINETFCKFPDSTTNLTVGQFIFENTTTQCFERTLNKHHSIATTGKLIIILLPLIILLVAFLLMAVLLFYYRWHVRYWIFLARIYLIRKGKIKPARRSTNDLEENNSDHRECFNNYHYDAFVSYSNEDRNFVVRLVTMLENYDPFLKLCVYERDFQIGTIISENVLDCVAKSRRTLLIISDSYAKSQWCRWESQIAEHHRLFIDNNYSSRNYVDDSLVLVKLGPVSAQHLTPTLKYLLKTRIYLQWDGDERKQKVFWSKLRGTLAPPPSQLIEENTHM